MSCAPFPAVRPQVVRVLSYWCSERSCAVLSVGSNGAHKGFVQLLQPRLTTPAFLDAVAAQGTFPELLVFCSGCENVRWVGPLPSLWGFAGLIWLQPGPSFDASFLTITFFPGRVCMSEPVNARMHNCLC